MAKIILKKLWTARRPWPPKSPPVFRPGLVFTKAEIISSLIRVERHWKIDFLKFISNSPVNLSFLLILNSNDKYLCTLPHPIPDQFGQNLYRPSVFGPVWRKNRTLWGSKYDMDYSPTSNPASTPRRERGGGGGGGGRLCQRYAFRSFSKRHECRFWNIPNAPNSLFRVVLNVPGKSALVWISLLINYFQGQSVVLRSRQTLIDLVHDACVSSCQQNCYFSRTQWTFLDKLLNSLLDY